MIDKNSDDYKAGFCDGILHAIDSLKPTISKVTEQAEACAVANQKAWDAVEQILVPKRSWWTW